MSSPMSVLHDCRSPRSYGVEQCARQPSLGVYMHHASYNMCQSGTMYQSASV